MKCEIRKNNICSKCDKTQYNIYFQLHLFMQLVYFIVYLLLCQTHLYKIVVNEPFPQNKMIFSPYREKTNNSCIIQIFTVIQFYVGVFVSITASNKPQKTQKTPEINVLQIKRKFSFSVQPFAVLSKYVEDTSFPLPLGRQITWD